MKLPALIVAVLMIPVVSQSQQTYSTVTIPSAEDVSFIAGKSIDAINSYRAELKASKDFMDKDEFPSYMKTCDEATNVAKSLYERGNISASRLLVLMSMINVLSLDAARMTTRIALDTAYPRKSKSSGPVSFALMASESKKLQDMSETVFVATIRYVRVTDKLLTESAK